MDSDPRRERTLYITELDEDVTEELLYELFLQAGPLEQVSLKAGNMENRSKPFAFVEYKHEESLPYAMALFHGIQLFGKAINIRPRDKTEMAEKLKHAAREARQLRLHEQTPHVDHLQRQIRWPPPHPTEPFPHATTFTRMAVAQLFHPMTCRQFFQSTSPPPPNYHHHQFVAPTPPPLASWQSMGDFSSGQQQHHYGGGGGGQQRSSAGHYRDEHYSPYHRSSDDHHRNGGGGGGGGGGGSSGSSGGRNDGRHLRRSQSDQTFSDDHGRRRNGGRHNRRY